MNPGDRVELIRMDDDPDPIEPGQQGTVQRITKMGDGSETVEIEWDNGRTLAVIIPPDECRVVS